MDSYFFIEAQETVSNEQFIKDLKTYSEENKVNIYVLSRPLTDQKYTYKYSDALIVLTPKSKVLIINFGYPHLDFGDYIEDVIEDIGFISDKYLYKEAIGRPRIWKETLVAKYQKQFVSDYTIPQILEMNSLGSKEEVKKNELLISLFIGSINDIKRVKESVPETTLEKIKQKIQLFDGDQTRFIYQNPQSKTITIQGLSGTGKTELLLHKLKDVYINDPESKIYFTCHNKILADNLRKRIPIFFDFMKVEKQIEWNERLWCTNAWGSEIRRNSGTYSFICSYYDIPFRRYSYGTTFGQICALAVKALKEKFTTISDFAFSHMFIDESQDFDSNFFELCNMVTKENVYIAGDIFQNIFDENITSSIEPDFLLSKCYRTDPKTLMFAHALGMGLFEEKKLRWLEKKEWIDCGYKVEQTKNTLCLSREPIRRFEDIDKDYKSVEIIEFEESYSETIIKLISYIINENPAVEPDDIGIIILDNHKRTYRLADILEVKINQEFNWDVNKAYETKSKKVDTVFISNRNNVKGLEFPFIICVSTKIQSSLSYRNSLYTMLTRSFIKSYLLLPSSKFSGLTAQMENGLKEINENNQMVILEPTSEEKEQIRTRFKSSLRVKSQYEQLKLIFENGSLDLTYIPKIARMVQDAGWEDYTFEELEEFVNSNYKYIR